MNTYPKQHPKYSGSPEEVNASQQDFVFKGPKLTEADIPRLNTKARAVWDIMAGHTYPDVHRKKYGWYNLNELAVILRMPHSSLSAAVRAFRYPENGGHKVDTRRETEDEGTWLYKLIPNTPEGAAMARASASAKHVSHDELLELRSYITKELTRGWAVVTPALEQVVEKIDEMVKARPEPKKGRK